MYMNIGGSQDKSQGKDSVPDLPLVSYKEERDTLKTPRVYQLVTMNSSYIAYHIRRGDFHVYVYIICIYKYMHIYV
jgi:hypothetical protein